jgi:regulator of sigma E protease
MSFEWLYFYALPFIVVLTVVVFVHEMGHFLLARKNGVKVEVFSIGIGPEIFGFNDKQGTRWKFSWLPFGGYVKMFSDADISSMPDTEAIKEMTPEERAYSHHHKTVWQKFQIAAGGPLANYAFGILLFSLVYMFHGQRVDTDDPIIGHMATGEAAATAGLLVGDKILSVDNHKVTGFLQLREFIREHPGVSVDMQIERGGQQITKPVVPKSVVDGTSPDGPKHVGILGISPPSSIVQRGPLEAVGSAFYDAYSLTVKTFANLGGMIIGTRSVDGLTGPIGIAKATGDIATTDFPTFIWFIAFISINLGFVNLLPVPVLDGGHLMFYIIEAARGKPLSERTQENAFRVGLVLVLSLFLFTTYKDVESIHLFSKFMSLFN